MTKKKEIKKVKKQKEKSKKQKNNQQGFWHSITMEMKKVKWPTFKEMVKYTIATIVLVIIIALLFEILNVIVSLIKGVM